MADVYTVLEKKGRHCLTSRKDNKDYYPGEAIDLSHLSKPEIELLITTGEVKKGATTTKEEKRGE